MTKKRKGTPWGPKNPLWRWQHRKANKSASRKSHVVGVKKLTKRRTYRKKYYKRSRDKAIPLAAAAGLVAIPLAHGEYSIFNRIKQAFQGQGSWEDAGKQAVLNLTGYSPWDGQFHGEYLLPTYMPAVVGGLVSKFIGGGPLNLNRKIPKIIRRYIKI